MAKQSEAMEILFHEVSCYLTSAGQILNKEWTFKIFQCEWLNKKSVQGWKGNSPQQVFSYKQF